MRAPLLPMYRTSARRRAGIIGLLVVTLAGSTPGVGQTDDVVPRVALAAGMGVNLHNAQDIVALINNSGVVSRRVDEFKSGVEFFGSVSVPLSTEWVVKLEYAHLIASYLEGTSFGSAEFSYFVAMPTLIGQYVLHSERMYNFKVGVGGGYHFGAYSQRYSLVDGKYTSTGVGTLIELEANTALGENVFAHLGTQVRWDFVGDLKNASGNSPGGSFVTSLHFFSIGARLGVAVYL